jgi:Icc-related predicted phosphoesterase
MGEPLLVLGDLLNFIDYRTYDGLLTEVAGRDLVIELVGLRARGEFTAAGQRWGEFASGREEEIRARYRELIVASYQETRAALEGARGFVTYGNVDQPELLAEMLPDGVRFVDGEVVPIEGFEVGFAGGGIATPLGTPGEVSEDEMAEKLSRLGPVDVLCTHVAPAVAPLSTDVVGGRVKESQAILDYIEEHQPGWHYFGDIHQPQAVTWRVGRTTCINAGYFRATERPLRHG